MALILMIEDNSDNRFIFRAILEHHGHVVVEAGDGQTGVAAARRHLPDLILLDIGMPIMDGWEAVRRLKADPLTSATPVIAVTAHALRSDEERAREVGFDEFVRKPVEPKRVAEVVAEVLSRFGHRPPE